MTKRQLVIHPDDLAKLRSQLPVDVSVPVDVSYRPDTMAGVRVVESIAVPHGTVLMVSPVELEFQLEPQEPPVVPYFRFHTPILKAPSIFVTLCEGAAPIKVLTKAQRRRLTKRFIREEIYRRRMEARR